jgi:hypothetical protein
LLIRLLPHAVSISRTRRPSKVRSP